MERIKKIGLAFISGIIYYVVMDCEDESFFNLYNPKFYLKFLLSVVLGLILVLTIKGGKNN